MKSVFSGFIGLFTRNWGLKILALALAIVIYHSLKPSATDKTGRAETQHDRTLFQSR